MRFGVAAQVPDAGPQQAAVRVAAQVPDAERPQDVVRVGPQGRDVVAQHAAPAQGVPPVADAALPSRGLAWGCGRGASMGLG